MSYSINLGEWNDVFVVPKSVVNNHIKLAKEDFVKVLLVLLSNGGKDTNLATICEMCNISAENVEDALLYWENCGIIKLIANGEFVPANEISADKEKTSSLPAGLEKNDDLKEHSVSKNVKIRTNQPIRLSSLEISKRIEATAELKWAISETERMFGRFLTQSEISALVALFDYANISADIIIMIVEYCVSIDKANLRFIEKTAYSWIDNGIDTHKKVEEHITSLITKNNNEMLVKSAFGIWDHNLTAKQKDYISTWIGELGFSIEMLKIAYEKCVDNTGKMSFPYINKVLLNWKNNSLSTPDDVEKFEAKRRNDTIQSTFDAQEFDSLQNYTVPKLGKKSKPKGN